MAAPLPNLDRYLAALWPDTYRCLGRRLLPLRIGHILLLRRIGSPFGQPTGKIPDAVDIALAVEICSRKVFAGVDLIGSRWIFLRLFSLAFKAQFRRVEAARHLFAYLEAGTIGPAFWKPAGGKTSATPFWLSVIATLCRDFGRTREEALESVASAALWECGAIWESNDAASFQSDDERLAMDRLMEEAPGGN